MEKRLSGGSPPYLPYHHRLTDDRQAPGLHNPHTHVVLPGTVYDEEHGQRVPLFFSRNQKVNHIEMLHDVTEQSMADLMERYAGPDWEHRYDELALIRAGQTQVTYEAPHGQVHDDQGRTWDMWCGTRRTDEQTTAVGYYRYFPNEDDPDTVYLEFRQLIAGLPHDQAEFFAQVFAREMNGDLDRLKELIAQVSALPPDGREALMGILSQPEHVAPDFER